MFSRLLLLITLFAAAITASAENARKLMDATASQIEKSSSIKASFTIRQGESTTYGDITLKGKRFHLDMPGLRCWFDGKTQYTYVKENEEVNISEPDEEEIQSINPYRMLYLYKSGYILKTGKKTELKGKKVTEVIMIAKDKKAVYSQVNLIIDSSCNLLRVQALQQKTWTTIDITSFTRNANVSDSTFHFDRKMFPNAEIVDLR